MLFLGGRAGGAAAVVLRELLGHVATRSATG